MSEERAIELEPEWKAVLAPEFRKPYMSELRRFLLAEKQAGKVIFPPGPEIFAAFNRTPFSKVRLVILGQDPYHGPGQAHGLCFSVRPGIPAPPSLQNIYKEMAADLEGFTPPPHGHLESWCDQGVLLLNAVLTVERHRAGSHQNRGWETLTDRAIAALNRDRDHLVFLLWGAYAQRKGAAIDSERHLVIKTSHPSPLAAHRGFLGSRQFSRANAYLSHHGTAPIRWQLS